MSHFLRNAASRRRIVYRDAFQQQFVRDQQLDRRGVAPAERKKCMARLFKRLTRAGKPSDHWWASWKNHRNRKRTRSTGTADEETARIIANDWEAEDALARAGRAKPIDRSSIDAALKDYEASKRAAGRTDGYINGELAMIRQICATKGMKTVQDIAADRVSAFAVELRETTTKRKDNKPAKRQGRSQRTVHKHLDAINRFARWLVKTGRIAAAHLA